MAEASTEPAYNTLTEFLDTLPLQPCKSPPINRYYCTVCARLKKPVALRCEYSKYKGTEKTTSEGVDDTIQFIQMGDTSTEGSTGKTVETSTELEKVEFKVVAPMKADDDYPLIELVQPKDKKIEPIEMELLEDVAIEFEVSKDEPMEVEALEVTSIYEFEDDEESTGMEVEAIEAEPVEAFEDDLDLGELENFPEFKPLEQQPSITPEKAPTQTKPTFTKVKHKVKPKKKLGKGPVSKRVGVPGKRIVRKPKSRHLKRPMKRAGITTPALKKPIKKTVQPKIQPQVQPPAQPPQYRQPSTGLPQGPIAGTPQRTARESPPATATKRTVIVKKIPKV